MRILCAGDQHWTTRRPKNRKDDYKNTVLDKLKQELEIAEEEGCSVVIFPGDLFDTSKENHYLVQDILYELKEHKLTYLVIAGQHDQHFHNPNLDGTALGTLIAADAVRFITDHPTPCIINNVAFYGASWNEEIPEITTLDKLNVLVLHKMIVEEKLWAEQDNHTWANHILIKNKFDLIVSGDNHNQFIAKKNGKLLVNMGSMMRSNISQINHHPAVLVYDTETKEDFIIDLEVEPFDKVMQIEKATKEKERNEKLESFVQSLKTDETSTKESTAFDFVSAFKEKITDDLEPEVVDIINKCLEEVG